MAERTATYDPRKNSSFMNFLLRGIDGGYRKSTPPCSEEDISAHWSTSVTLGQFPLLKKSTLYVNGVLSVMCGAGGVYCIVAAAALNASLAVIIPVGIAAFAFSAFFASTVIFSAGAQHRYVLVELDCQDCEEEHLVLYDCITLQKRRRFGCYTNIRCKDLEVNKERYCYNDIEKAFEEMRGQLGNPFNPVAYNCKDWADELFMKITGIEN